MGREETVTFKGTRKGITLVLNAEADFGEVLTELREKLAKAGDFFGGAAVSVTISRALAPAEAQELVGVLCGEHGFCLAGLQNPALAPTPVPAATRPAAAVRPATGRESATVREQTLLVRRTVRSGQRVAFDGNVVVMGDLNPGGEVVATGDIIVWGALRGTAHAGAGGNLAATVTALRLMPTQLRIAHLITRAPDEGEKHKVAAPKTPEIARIKGEAVEVEGFAL